jgi:hypothetical protein
VIGTLATNDAAYPLTGRVAAYYYNLSFRMAMFGVPLFFCNEADVTAILDVLIPQMLAGL